MHAKAGTFPFPVQRVNGRYTVLKSDLMRFFGLPLPAADTPRPDAHGSAA